MTNKQFFAECERVRKLLKCANLACDIIRILRLECEVKKCEIAAALNVKKCKVEDIESGKTPSITHYGVLSDLRDIAVILLDTLSPKGVGQWLRAKNRLLKCRPLAALRDGRANLVREAAHAYVEGSYI